MIVVSVLVLAAVLVSFWWTKRARKLHKFTQFKAIKTSGDVVDNVAITWRACSCRCKCSWFVDVVVVVVVVVVVAVPLLNLELEWESKLENKIKREEASSNLLKCFRHLLTCVLTRLAG